MGFAMVLSPKFLIYSFKFCAKINIFPEPIPLQQIQKILDI